MSALAALASLRSVARHPGQVALSILGIALGVAVVVGIDLASASSLRGFRLASEALGGSATHEIRAGSAGLPDELFARLAAALPEVALAPVVEVQALARSASAPPSRARTTLTVFGVDPFSETRLRPWIAEGVGARAPDGSLALLTEPATGFLAEDAARALGVQAGDVLTLRIGSRVEDVHLLGTIAADTPRARVALQSVLVVDIATAQELAGTVGRLTRIDLAAGSDAAALARIAELLPPGAALEPAGLARRGLEQLTDAFRLNLRALSLLALLVGVFLVYNTMTFSVVQRRSLIATLRTLGVTRGEIFRVIAGEALWLGILGTALGILIGTHLAESLLVLITQTVNDLYFVVSVREVHVDWGLVLRAVLLGIGATIVGALSPAFEATREKPRLALAASTLETRARSWMPKLALLGIACVAGALLLFRWRTASLVPSFAGLLLVVVSAGLFTPLAAVRLSRAAAPVFGRAFGLLGRYAARGIEVHLSRTSVAIAALSVAISATIGMGVMIASFRATFVRWLELSIEADVYCSAPTLVSSHNESTLAPATVAALASAPGVAQVTTYRGFETSFRGAPVHAAAITMSAAREKSIEFLDAEPADVWSRFEGGEAVIVSESFGFRRGVERGDTVELATDRGPRTFDVLGTHQDFASDNGVVLISRATYERHWDDRGVTSLALLTAPGIDAERLVTELRTRVPEDEEVLVRSNRTLRENSLVVFDRTFAVTSVLRLLATLVAFVGVLSALLSLELERSRELGVLRAQGVTPREVQKLVLAETGLAGAIAGLAALPLGLAIALVLILVVNKRSFGWSLDIHLDPWMFASSFALALGAALLAGIVPAWRMSRSRPALALRGD